jgi:hypothetical protein
MKNMIKLSKKSKALVLCIAAVSLVLIATLPFANASTTPNDPTPGMKTLVAKGYAVETIDSQSKYQASFSLTLQPADATKADKKFSVISGTVVVDGNKYVIISGNGGVAIGKHAILLQAQGTSSDGQPVTLKLEGRYFWMGGHLYVARIAAKLQTDKVTYTMLMRAAIRV